MRISIRWKMAAAFFLMVAVVLTATNLFVLRTLETDYLQARERTYLANANIIALAGREDIVRQDRNAYYLARDFGAQVGARVLLLDRAGTVMIDSFDEPWLTGLTLTHGEVISALAGSSATGLHQVNEERVLYVAVPVRDAGTVQGAVMLVVGVNDIYEALDQVGTRMILVSLAGALLAAVLSLGLAGLFTRPVNQLTGAVRQMEQGRLDQRVPVTSRDELGDLARAFNSMAGRLELTDRHRQEFIASAAHELRSPLSSIKALAQSLADGGEKDPAVYREYLRDIDAEMDRLNRLVENLLRLARMEEQALQVSKEEQDVAGVIDHVAGFMEPLAAQKNVRLITRADAALTWPLDRDLIIRVLYNLVDNAVRHTPPGGEVRVEAEARRKGLLLRVADTGEGIPEADREYIFDRFYRVDKARARATGGAGLGLAIVRQAVTLHGGRISVDSTPGKGTVFEIRLPKLLHKV